MFTINIEDMKIVGSLIYLFLLVALYFDNNFVFESVEAKTQSEILTYFDLRFAQKNATIHQTHMLHANVRPFESHCFVHYTMSNSSILIANHAIEWIRWIGYETNDFCLLIWISKCVTLLMNNIFILLPSAYRRCLPWRIFNWDHNQFNTRESYWQFLFTYASDQKSFLQIT